MGRIYNNLSETIGGTPLVMLNGIKKKHNFKANILAKLEAFNPLSSIKDRIAVAMLNQAEQQGAIVGKTHFVEATSGNTGISLASMAVARGFEITLVMPESMSLERRKMLTFLGANLELTDAQEGMGGAILRVEQLVKEKGYVELAQFSNSANPEIHKKTTAVEIWEDTNGLIDVFIAGVGTGGTISGVGGYLKGRNPKVQIIAVEPEDSPVLSGGLAGPHKIQGIGAGHIPKNYNAEVIDEVIQIGNETSFLMSKELARTEGLPAGISSGATLAAAIEVAHRSNMHSKNIVVIFASSAERYLTTSLFDGV